MPAKAIRTAVAICIFSILGVLGSLGTRAQAANICEGEMTAAAAQYGVPLGVLYAVGLTETGRRNSLHPYALNIEGRPVFAANKRAAIREFETARKEGRKLIDIGCMQINHHYHGSEFVSVSQMFQPRANVQYAARFLKQLRSSHGSWTMAVARYHAGPDNDPAQKRYVCKVIENMVASGFGKWTGNARAFCK
ncbi:transglycosylase SLT domain-containing protein [Roseibium sp. RKSG952]|uniref:transglycosylase SLT domain-containing protein n=1 Tax=Roseibium sp. RKSG952 TaxID=2529384 RepID=UPI0012BD3896|nr:transglycosylase SLT domain-containing protein [Roseibium sp. RKSG952]MTH98285.1 lytic transglycosylase domain-containing protein [Roseibium sp. RKSG952]